MGVADRAGGGVEADDGQARRLPGADAAIQVPLDRDAGLPARLHGHGGALPGTTLEHDRSAAAGRQRGGVEGGKREVQRAVDSLRGELRRFAHVDEHDGAGVELGLKGLGGQVGGGHGAPFSRGLEYA